MPSCSSSNASSIEGLYGCFGSCLPPMLTFWSVNLADHGGPWAHSSKWTHFFHDFSGMPGRISLRWSWTAGQRKQSHHVPRQKAWAESMGITLEPLGCGGGTLSTSLRLCASFCRVCELVLHVKLHIHHITYICVLHIYLLDILYTPNTYSDPSRIQTPTLDLVSAIQVTRYQILSPWEMVRV